MQYIRVLTFNYALYLRNQENYFRSYQVFFVPSDLLIQDNQTGWNLKSNDIFVI